MSDYSNEYLLAHHQSIFVRKYSQYLEEKVLVYKILSVEFEKDASITKTYTVDEAFDRIPRLQSQMNALLNCRVSYYHALSHSKPSNRSDNLHYND